jgi:predicted GIY-YIG superfamily endonuclease
METSPANQTPNCMWICYCIKSTDSNKTYIGVTDNLWRRLQDHNGLHGKSRGAKATRGESWYPIFVVSGFCSIPACLSYEWHVKRVRKRPKVFGGYPKKVNNTVLKRIYDCSRLLDYGRQQSTLEQPTKWWNQNLSVIWLDNETRDHYLNNIKDWFTIKNIMEKRLDDTITQNGNQQWLGIDESKPIPGTASIKQK